MQPIKILFFSDLDNLVDLDDEVYSESLFSDNVVSLVNLISL